MTPEFRGLIFWVDRLSRLDEFVAVILAVCFEPAGAVLLPVLQRARPCWRRGVRPRGARRLGALVRLSGRRGGPAQF